MSVLSITPKAEDRMKLIEKYKLRLETEKDMPVLDKISNYYLLGNGEQQPGRSEDRQGRYL